VSGSRGWAKLVPTPRDSEKRPDFRVLVGNIEFGAGWKKTSKNGDFVSVCLDDPSFGASICANLVEAEDSNYILIWTRRSAAWSLLPTRSETTASATPSRNSVAAQEWGEASALAASVIFARSERFQENHNGGLLARRASVGNQQPKLSFTNTSGLQTICAWPPSAFLCIGVRLAMIHFHVAKASQFQQAHRQQER
jgi:uncharacterized protein (DUF736 family)